MYTYRVEQAIRAAAVLHKNQLRKGSMPFPYVTHLFATMLTVADYTHDEDTLIAALLHDTLEDTDYTADELEEDFGGAVREIVEAVTEPKSTAERKLSWREKKQLYAKQLKKGPKQALQVAAADKIHNFRTLIEDYHDAPERFVQDFGNNFSERLEAYQEIANVLNNRLEGELRTEFNYIFEEFKKFLIRLDDLEDSKYD